MYKTSVGSLTETLACTYNTQATEQASQLHFKTPNMYRK